MKAISIIAMIVLCILNTMNAQDTIQKNKIYRTWVYLNKDPFEIKGALYEIKDSSLSVSNSLVKKEFSTEGLKNAELNIINVETIKLRRNNNIVRGVLIGTGAGLVTGAMIGFISGDDPPCDNLGCILYPPLTAGQKALSNAAFLGICGAGAGALVGSFKIKIPINGNIETFHKSHSRLRKYSYRK